MAKSSRALSGAAKDAFLKRAVSAETELALPARDRLTARLQGEIATVSLKAGKAQHIAALPDAADHSAATDEPATVEAPEAARNDASDGVAPACPGQSKFDPYQPNVIVIIRTRGREAVLAQLADIADVEHLRLIAREQQLGIAADLASAPDIRQAIVAAAERRIANRRAAAS